MARLSGTINSNQNLSGEVNPVGNLTGVKILSLDSKELLKNEEDIFLQLQRIENTLKTIEKRLAKLENG